MHLDSGAVGLRNVVPVDGTDVSQWNGTVNWSCFKQNGCFWTAAQVLDRNNGNALDPKFHENRAGMAAQGFRYRLLYYFPVLNQPIGPQVGQYLSAVGPFTVAEGPMFDAEDDSKRGKCTEQITYDWVRGVEDSVQRPVGVYTGAFVDGGRIWNSTRIFDGTRPRILAAYTDEASMYMYASPHKPDTWQFSGSGSMCGSSPLDLDRVYNPTAFDACCGYKGSSSGDDEDELVPIYKRRAA